MPEFRRDQIAGRQGIIGSLTPMTATFRHRKDIACPS